MNILPEETSNEIYNILVEDVRASARDVDREQFIQAFSSTFGQEIVSRCKEYRFGGTYGMAGKFWWNNDKFYCSGWSRSEIDAEYYQEQEEDLQKVNARLTKIYTKYISSL